MIVAVEIPLVDDIVGGVVEDAAGAVLNAIVTWLFGLVAGAVESLTNELIGAMESTSQLDLSSAEFAALGEIRGQILGMALALMLGFLFVNVLRSVSKGEPGQVIRAALVDLPAAILFTTMYVVVADKAIELVDLASAALLSDVGESIGKVGAAIVAGNTITEEGVAANAVTSTVGAPAGGLMALVFAIIYIFAALLVWAELLIRSALVYIIIVAAPLGYAARASAGARQIARRTTEVLFGLIFAKLGIALAFSVGANMINSSTTIGEDGVAATDTTVDMSSMFIGCVVLLLAAFMPWMILKMIPVMEVATEMGGAERSPLKAAGAGAGLAVAAVGAGKLAGTGTGSNTASEGAAGAGAGGAGGGFGGGGGGSGGGSSGGGGSGAAAAGIASSALSSSGSNGATSAPSNGGGGSGVSTGVSAGSAPGTDTLVGTASGGESQGSGVEYVQVGAPAPGVVSVPAPISASAVPASSSPATTSAPLGSQNVNPQPSGPHPSTETSDS